MKWDNEANDDIIWVNEMKIFYQKTKYWHNTKLEEQLHPSDCVIYTVLGEYDIFQCQQQKNWCTSKLPDPPAFNSCTLWNKLKYCEKKKNYLKPEKPIPIWQDSWWIFRGNILESTISILEIFFATALYLHLNIFLSFYSICKVSMINLNSKFKPHVLYLLKG